MALTAAIILSIREHIGNDPDFADDEAKFDSTKQEGDLETIYDVYAGNAKRIDRTALHVWRVRLGNHQARSFDVAQEGNWLARSQRGRFLQRQVDKYERRAGDKGQGKNAKLQSQAEGQVSPDLITE